MPRKKKSPSPGSDEAINKGCICPILDNNRGKGVYKIKKDTIFIYNLSCPVHRFAK